MSDAYTAPASQPSGQGPLLVAFRNATDIGGIVDGKKVGIVASPARLSYPDREQPKPWKNPEHWRGGISNLPRLPAASPIYRSLTSAAWVRPFPVVWVVDRGSQQVERGKSYRFEVETSVGVRLAFDLVGVEGGSVVRPGFSVYDLPDRPGAWTTFWAAKDFVDEWSLRVSSPHFDSWGDLSVQLVPYPKRIGGFDAQRLIFTIAGVGSTLLAGMGLEDAEGEEMSLFADGAIGPTHVRAKKGTFVIG